MSRSNKITFRCRCDKFLLALSLLTIVGWVGVWGIINFVRSAIQHMVSSSFAEYRSSLVENPLLTKCISAGVVSFSGDVLAQTIERIVMLRMSSKQLSLYRAATVAAEGMFVSGPLLHFAYQWLDGFTHSLEGVWSAWLLSLFQVAFDLFVMDTVFVATLMVTSGLLQGRLKDVPRELRYEFIPAVRVSWLSAFFMSPIQFMNFGYVPVEFRVLITNFEDVVWNSAVSYMAHRTRY